MNGLMTRALILALGAGVDMIVGDPHSLWHPVIGFGKLISWLEKALYSLLHLSTEPEKDKYRKRMAGGLLAVLVILIPTAILLALDKVLGMIHPALSILLYVIVTWQMLAMKSLKVAAEEVRKPLAAGDVEKARYAVSMVVGRDTASLDAEGITKAAIETVAENASDGVIAPLFYMIVFGPLGGWIYKCINTMDSMIGYRNDRYQYFGTAAARLDDIVNFIPARLAAIAMILGTGLLSLLTGGKKNENGVRFYDMKNAWKMHRRDRYKHPSPNSAQTESTCAGALNIQLAGDAWYFGVLHHKPTLGDANRRIEIEDIRRSEHIMVATAAVVFLIGELVLLLCAVC